MKLIDADELRKTLFVYAPVTAQSVITFCIDHMPAFEIVNCGNCRYKSEYNVGDKYPCQLGGYVTNEDFCNRGEKKE